jgi:glycosyltransferase involved in cell wall biosynthesis
MTVLAVVPLYHTQPTGSIGFRSLIAASACCADVGLAVLLYDNTPSGQESVSLPANVRYVAGSSNAGLATAYNRALEIAGAESAKWLLTLDQDTRLPPEFIAKMGAHMAKVEDELSVAAIVPRVVGDGRALSPYWFRVRAFPTWIAPGYTGIPQEAVFALNSASILRVAALRQAGGYDPWFWMDDSDACMYRRLHRNGKRVYVAGDIVVEHNFSMLDMNRRMTPGRYENIMRAETAFWDLNMNALAGCERTLRLTARLVKHVLRKDDPELRRITRQFLWKRLFQGKQRRIEDWRSKTMEQMGDTIRRAAYVPPARPKVSVCMAAYNGERFIHAQLETILPQLDVHDEVIIVDDASTDGTVKQIKKLQDNRIALIQHSARKGAVATFEDAIRSASGDILFLSDDDDLWAPDKVQKYLAAFAADADVRVVTSKVSLIDQNDVRTSDPRFRPRNGFSAGFLSNVIQNKYQGSAMAFRASLLAEILPFPADLYVLHDVWIGTRNALCGGKTSFLDDVLLLYRRHDGNFSYRLNWALQLKKRVHLLWAHTRFCWRRL